MTLQDFVVGAALVVAMLALLRARHLSKRLERLGDSYWDLRYEYGQLRARMDRVEGGTEPSQPPLVPQPGSGSFVPLSSLKR